MLLATWRTPTHSPAAQVISAATTASGTERSANVPENSARSASTMYVSGLKRLTTCIHSGPASSGNIIPDKINSGNSKDCWTAQNIHSRLREAIANALENAPMPTPKTPSRSAQRKRAPDTT